MMFRSLNRPGGCAILLPWLLFVDVAAGPLVLMPKQAETILEYRSQDGLPEKSGWNRTLAGKDASTVTAVIKSGLLDLRDESDGLDGLTYKKTIDPKWSEGMARDGWILELYLKVHGSTIRLDQEKASAETCAVHLLDKDGTIIHRVQMHLDPETDGGPGPYSWRVNGTQHRLEDGDSIRLESVPGESGVVLRLGGRTRRRTGGGRPVKLPHAIEWGSFPSSGTSLVSWTSLRLSLADSKPVDAAKARAMRSLGIANLERRSGLSFSEPMPARFYFEPFSLLKYANREYDGVKVAISAPHARVDDNYRPTVEYMLGGHADFGKNHGTVSLLYDDHGFLRMINVFAEIESNTWSRNERGISQINRKGNESNAELVERALSEYFKRAESSPDSKNVLPVAAALSHTLPLYHEEFHKNYFIGK